LNDDPILLEECLARPALIERLEAIDRAVEAGIDSDPDAISRTADTPAATASVTCVSDTWTPINSLGAPTPRHYHTAVWTGTEMIVWGGVNGATPHGDGARYDPLLDLWRPMTTIDAPPARYLHTAVWTGSEMIVWGGTGSGAGLGDGGRYDPIANQWHPVSLVGSPPGRSNHTAVWTGARMIVWGGSPASCQFFRDGGQYDPSTNTWTPTAIPGFLEARTLHTAVWTGSEMIVFGGVSGVFSTGGNTITLLSGGRYEPVSDTWQPMTT